MGSGGSAGRAAAAADAKRAEGVLAKGIHFVFARALRRFQGDLRLWRRYFDFCKAQGGGKALGRALARALRLHPAEPGLWTAAADWEFNGRRSPAAARAPMQRGLRVCGARAPQLWASYFQLELQYARQLQVRQGVVGLDGRPGERAAQAVLEGAAAQAVLRGALKQLGASAGLCERFLRAVRGFERGAFPKVEAAVLEAAASELPADSAAWDLRARASLGDGEGLGAGPLGADAAGGLEGLERARSVYEAGLEATGHAVAMYEAYLRFASKAVEGLGGESQREGASSGPTWEAAVAWARRALALHEDAESRGRTSEELLLARVELLAAVERPAAARKAALGGLESFPESFEVWRKCWDLHAAAAAAPAGPGRATSSSGAPRRLRLIYEAGLAALPSARLAEVAEAAAALFCEGGAGTAGGWGTCWLTRPLKSRLLEAGPLGRAEARHLQSAAAGLLGAVREHEGLGQARGFYQSILARPGPALSLFEKALDVEEGAAFEGTAAPDRASCKILLALFEQCLMHHGAHAWEVWLRLVQVNERLGDDKRADETKWRAQQALEDSQAFQHSLNSGSDSDSDSDSKGDGSGSASEEEPEPEPEPEPERPRRRKKRQEKEQEPEPERPRRRKKQKEQGPEPQPVPEPEPEAGRPRRRRARSRA